MSAYLWLYRVAETDDDGDPLDWGVLQATTKAAVIRQLARHFKALGIAGWDGGTLPVKLYQGVQFGPHGVLESVDAIDVTITVKADRS